MQAAEFTTWWNDLKLRFPTVRGWIAKNAVGADGKPSQEVAQATLKTWREVLADVPLAAAQEVSAKLQRGDLPWLGDYEPIDRLPQHVRRLAKQLAWESENRSSASEPPPRPSDFPAGKILRLMQRLVADGVTEEQAREQALAQFPIGTSTREPQYRCPQCLDVQNIEVATPAAIRAMLDGTFATCIHRAGGMRCGRCDHRKPQDKFKICVYDPERDFRIEDRCWRPAEVERFAAWVEFQKNRSAEQRAKSRPNYDPALAGWNRE